MTEFGLVTEGITDQVVIRNILNGYFDKIDDLSITERQPLLDGTDKARASNFGGWGNLIAYCKSDDFRESFQFIRYIILHIDTDKAEEFGVSKKMLGADLTVQETVDGVIAQFVDWIGLQFFELVKDRIIFAIAVDSTECWLLPIYYQDKRREKTVNCLNTLNQELNKQEGFTIHTKEYAYYEKISKPFRKKKQLDQLYPHNPSFKLFVEQLGKCSF